MYRTQKFVVGAVVGVIACGTPAPRRPAAILPDAAEDPTPPRPARPDGRAPAPDLLPRDVGEPITADARAQTPPRDAAELADTAERSDARVVQAVDAPADAAPLDGMLTTPPALVVTVTGKPTSAADDPAYHGAVDGAGNTSVSNDATEKVKGGSPDSCCGYFLPASAPPASRREVPYVKRDRDLGQTFTYQGPTGRRVDAITVRTGFGDNVVRPGMYRQPISLQVFEVSGTATIHDNGTTAGNTATHGVPHTNGDIPAGRDDYVSGETYTSLAVARGGTFPSPSAFGCAEATPAPTAACLKGKYLRFELGGDDEVTLTKGKRYAFVLMIDEQGVDRGFTVANTMRSPSSDAYAGGHGIRREGNGTFPPAPADPTAAVTAAANRASLEAANFPAFEARVRIPPGTNGYPDVDTYRDLEFHITTKP